MPKMKVPLWKPEDAKTGQKNHRKEASGHDGHDGWGASRGGMV